MQVSCENKIWRVLCLLTVCIFLLTGCARTSAPPRVLRVTECDFSAEAQGVMNGQQLRVLLTVTCGEGTKRTVRAEYLSPPVLNGVTVTADVELGSDEERLGLVGLPVSSDTQISYQGHTLAVASGTLDGLLLPATVLLSLGTPASIQKGSNTYTLTFENNITLVLSADGTPAAFSSAPLTVEFTSWSWG